MNKLVDLLEEDNPPVFEHIVANPYLVGQKYAVIQSGIMYVSPSVYFLMGDEEAVKIMLGSLDVLPIRKDVKINEMYKIANEVFGGEKMEVKTEILVEGTIKLESRSVPYRVTRTHGGDVDVLNQEINMGNKSSDNWLSIYEQVFSEGLITEFYFAVANKLIHEKIHGKK